MKSNDIKQLHTKSVTELQTEIGKLESELVDLRMQQALNKNKNVRDYKNKRQSLARYKTVLKEILMTDQTSGRN